MPVAPETEAIIDDYFDKEREAVIASKAALSAERRAKEFMQEKVKAALDHIRENSSGPFWAQRFVIDFYTKPQRLRVEISILHRRSDGSEVRKSYKHWEEKDMQWLEDMRLELAGLLELHIDLELALAAHYYYA